MANPRKIALNVLNKIEQEDAYSNLALNNCIKAAQADKRDSAFACALVYGVLERKLTLDHIISQFTKTKLKKIDCVVLNILRTAVFQIAYMDKVPNSAAVNESVKLCRQFKKTSAGSFVNGVLRSVVRADGKWKMPQKSDDLLTYLSVNYSCPQEIVHMWIDAYGDDLTEEILQNLCGRPPVFVCVNTLKITAEKLADKLKSEGVSAVSPYKGCQDALMLEDTGALDSLQSFKQGLFYVQDLSSQRCCRVLNPQQDNTVYDCCAAPGGKTFTICRLMNNSGTVYALDLYDHKLKLIEDSAKRLGISIINTVQQDASTASFAVQADRVLCDVPCSGLGIIRRKPEIRYKKNTGVMSLCQLQYEILNNCCKAVKKGGILVYSTCTLNPKENNENADRFLKEHDDFSPLKIDIDGLVRKFKEPENQFTIFPQKNGGDGFFISAFVRNR